MVRQPVLGVDFLTRLTHPQIEAVPHPSEVNDPANTINQNQHYYSRTPETDSWLTQNPREQY